CAGLTRVVHSLPTRRSSDLLDRAEAHDLGRQAGDAGGHDAGERREAELLGLDVGHDHQDGGAVVERAAVAGVDGAVGAEDRLELRDLHVGGAGPRAVVAGYDGAGGQGDRGGLTGDEAALDAIYAAVLRAHARVVLVLTGDAGHLGDVLGGLAHGDVDVGQEAVLARVGPRGGAALGARGGAGLGVGEHGVVRVRDVVRGALGEVGDG